MIGDLLFPMRLQISAVILLSAALLLVFGSISCFADAPKPLAEAFPASNSVTAAHSEVVSSKNNPEVISAKEEPGLFSFDPVVLISQFINFFILLFLLNRFFFGPIGEIIEQRAKKVASELEEAKSRRLEAESMIREYQAKLASFEQTCYQLRQEAISEGQKARDAIIAEAKAKASSLIEQARREIAIERERAWAELKEKMIQITMLAAEKVIETSLDDEKHHDLIRHTIERLEVQNREVGTS